MVLGPGVAIKIKFKPITTANSEQNNSFVRKLHFKCIKTMDLRTTKNLSIIVNEI